jgi:MFS transporter, DHA2 family, multidrug resistance protein
MTTTSQPQTSRTSRSTSRPTRRQWIALGVLSLTALLLSLDVSVLYLALPELSADLGATTTEQLWMLDIYSFVLAGFLVTMGAVGDRVGRKRLLLIGAVGFGAVSVGPRTPRAPVS